MATTRELLAAKSWTREDYLISTDSNLVPVQRVIEIFDSDDFYWARSMPPEETRLMLQSSLVFGLYHNSNEINDSSKAFIGFARCVTDYTTFAYLTDVWVDSRYQGKGLGSWLVKCIDEALDSMPYLRRSLLFTGDWKRSVPFYQKLIGMEVENTKPGVGLAIMTKLGPGHPSRYQQT